jgi:hypothetical protein
MDAALGEMLDTSPEQRRRYYELLRALTPEQRARKSAALTRAVRMMALAGIRQQHPDADDVQVLVLLAERMYGSAAAEIIARRPRGKAR